MKFLRKIIVTKLRAVMKDMKANSWAYSTHRQQQKLKKRLSLFKVMSMIQDKIKGSKYAALSKIKE